MTYDPATRDPASAASRGRSYDVGYGKPPHHTRFQKGQSGNPGGRPRGSGTERVTQLALDEAYREVAIDEDGEARMMPAIQAVIRAQLAFAAKGNGPAQRAVLKMVQEIETERAAVEAEEAARRAHEARRIAYLRRLAEEEERYEKAAQAAEAGAQAADASEAQANDGTTASAPTAGPSDGAARLRPSSTGYGGGEPKGPPVTCDCPATGGEKEKALAADAPTVPQEKVETRLGPQASRTQHGSSAQDGRRDERYFSNSLLFSLFSGKAANGHPGDRVRQFVVSRGSTKRASLSGRSTPQWGAPIAASV
jgi:uncharacterized protein DUF5681